MDDKDFKDRCDVEFVHEDNVKSVVKMLPEDRVIVLLAEIFKTLGDPTRIKILYILIYLNVKQNNSQLYTGSFLNLITLQFYINNYTFYPPLLYIYICN